MLDKDKLVLIKDRVKNHISEHKTIYTAGTIVVVGGVAFYLGARFGSANAVTNKASNKAMIVFGDQTIKIITVVQRDGRGHPGYPVMNMITKEWWKSATACAEAEGIPIGLLRGCLQGKFSDVDGVPYAWVSLVPVPAT